MFGVFPKSELFLTPPSNHFPDDDKAGMNANPDGEFNTMIPFQMRIEGGNGVNHAETGKDSSLGVVFMGLRIAEIDQ